MVVVVDGVILTGAPTPVRGYMVQHNYGTPHYFMQCLSLTYGYTCWMFVS